MIRRLFLAGLAGIALAGAMGSAVPAQDTSARDLARITNYLNGITTLEGNFIQVGPDGELSEGVFYLRRPGRLRFEYEPPNPALIIADGTWVGVYDKRLKTLDRIPIGSTPLDILLSKRVDLRDAGAVQKIENQGGLMRVTAIDPDAPDQGSITMVFADNPLELRQWIVIDPQGLTTTVALSDIRSNVELDAKLFFIEDPKR